MDLKVSSYVPYLILIAVLVSGNQDQNIQQQQQQQNQAFQQQQQQQPAPPQQQAAQPPAANQPHPVQAQNQHRQVQHRQEAPHVHAPAYSIQGATQEDLHMHQVMPAQGHAQPVHRQGQPVQQHGQPIHGHGQPIHHMPHQGQGSQLHNRELVHDREHVMEHLDGMVKPENTNHMTDDEVQFHYFKLHDYNNDNRLDGIELISAMTHYHKDENEVGPRIQDDEIANMVDSILEEDDRNFDGYIDYSEFILSQNADVD